MSTVQPTLQVAEAIQDVLKTCHKNQHARTLRAMVSFLESSDSLTRTEVEEVVVHVVRMNGLAPADVLPNDFDVEEDGS